MMPLNDRYKKRALVGLTICMLSTMWSFGAAEAKEQAAREQQPAGLVVARLAHNMSRINVFFPRFTDISVKGGPKNSTVTLYAEPAPSGLGAKQTTMQFAQLLPPGQYQLIALGSTSGSMSTESKIDGSLPTFEVTSGGVIDLGLLLVQPTGSGKAVVLPIDEPTAVDELLRTYFPDKLAGASGKTVARWPGIATWTAHPFSYGDTDAPAVGLVGDIISASIEKGTRLGAQARWQEAKSAADYLAIAKTTTTMLSEPAVAADGTMYFGSALGQVQRRAPDGTWAQIDTGLLVEISALALLADDTLAVGTEDGRLLRQESAGGKFVAITRFTPNTRVLDLQRWPDGSWWVTTRVEQGKELATHVYSGKSLAELDMTTPVKTLTQSQSTVFSIRYFATPAVGKTKYFVGVSGVESHTYDSATATWAPLATKKAALQPISNNSGSVLLNMKPLQISTDDGASWLPVKIPGKPLYVAFFNASEGLAVRAPAAMGTPDMEVQATTDGGKTWNRVNTVPKFPCDEHSLQQNDIQKRIFCVFHDGSINSTGMQGDWVSERLVY